MRANLTASLSTLGVDYVDLYLVHWPDPQLPFAETAAAMASLRDEGLTRHIGVSNFTAAQMTEFAQGAPIEVMQPGYSMLYRTRSATCCPTLANMTSAFTPTGR